MQHGWSTCDTVVAKVDSVKETHDLVAADVVTGAVANDLAGAQHLWMSTNGVSTPVRTLHVCELGLRNRERIYSDQRI
jgi:hypothetical protein